MEFKKIRALVHTIVRMCCADVKFQVKWYRDSHEIYVDASSYAIGFSNHDGSRTATIALSNRTFEALDAFDWEAAHVKDQVLLGLSTRARLLEKR